MMIMVRSTKNSKSLVVNTMSTDTSFSPSEDQQNYVTNVFG